MMRINCHAHGIHAGKDASGKLCRPLMMAWKPGAMTPEAYVQHSRDHRVDQILLLDEADIAFQVKAIFGDFVLPAPMVDIDKITPAGIEGLFKRGAVGIKFIAPSKSYGDDSYFPLYDVIRAHRGLAVFHTGYLVLASFEPGGFMARDFIVDITDMRPAALDRVGRAFPDLKMLMAHFGNPWWEEAWKVISSHRNIYADFSGGTACRRSMNMWRDMFAPNNRLDTAALGKLCFGTDGQCFVPEDNNEPIHRFYDELYECLKMPQELRDKIDRGNMEMLVAR